MTSLDIDNLTFSIDTKFIGNREGSCNRTAIELAEVFIGDACHLLKIEEPELLEEDQEFIHDTAFEYEGKLNDAGYTVVWDDGYFIYKDLTEEELEYITNLY
jgi:hypothetical protein